LNEALKQGTRGSTEGRARGRFRATLVVLEVAMAVTLLASSGLVIRSFIRLMTYEPGFQIQGTAFVRFNLRVNYGSVEQEGVFANALLARIQSTPGVEAVGITTFFPLSGNYGPAAGFAVEGGATLSVVDRPLARVYYVSPDYFRTLEIPLKRGRFFSERDDAKAPRVAIINQTLARQHFPNQDPIGKRITIAFGPEGRREIVGVVGDVGHGSLDEIQPPQLYEPYAQKVIIRAGDTVVVARGSRNASLLPGLIKSHVQALDPNLPVGEMRTVESFLHDKLTMQRLTLRLITAFSAIGLLIAATGIYGVIAFSVSQRTVEIGIRMALGAQKPDVLRLVLRQGAWMIAIGFGVGIVTTFIAGRAIESHLYNTGAHDPVALVGVSLVFAAVAALACWLPARRATKVDPIVALRAE
jgi:putative ABC transport system permease protein